VRRWVRAEDVGVAAFAWQHAGPSLQRGDSHVWAALEQLDIKQPATIRWHAALAVGDALAADAGMSERDTQRAFAMLAQFVHDDPSDDMLRAAVATAAHPEIAQVLRGLAERTVDRPEGSKPLRAAFAD